MKIQRRVNEGEMIPFGYGFVNYDFARDCRVFAPMPINWIIRWTFGFMYWARMKSYRPLTDDEIKNHERVKAEVGRQLFSHGIERYNAGYEYGFGAGWKACGEYLLQKAEERNEVERMGASREIGEDNAEA